MDETGRMNRDSHSLLHPSSLILHPFKGQLRLIFERARASKQTVLTVCEQHPPLKFLRDFRYPPTFLKIFMICVFLFGFLTRKPFLLFPPLLRLAFKKGGLNETI